MSKTNDFENDLLELIFNATTLDGLAENDTTSPVTNLYVSLHTAWPGETGEPTTSEAAYTSYSRVAVARTSGGWTVTGNSVSPVAAITFPAATGGSESEFYFGIGTDAAGTGGRLLYWGVIGSNMGPFTAKVDDTITIPGHTFAVNDRVAFFTYEGSTLPTGVVEGTVYHVITVSGDDITVSTTQGGSALNITAVGDGYAAKVTPIVVYSGVTPSLTTATTIKED
jgi:hypothetical protein